MQLLNPLFGSTTKSLEVLNVIEGVKPVTRQGFYDHELRKVKLFCEKNGLFITQSDFKVSLSENNGYSNKGFILKNGNGMTFAYISKDFDKAEETKKHEANHNHYLMGRSLGYPRCCCQSFKENEPLESKGKNTYESPLVKKFNGKKYPFFRNIFLRHMDCCLLSHFPCDLNCKESIAIGKASLNVLKKYDLKTAMEVVAQLKGNHVIHNRKVHFVLK